MKLKKGKVPINHSFLSGCGINPCLCGSGRVCRQVWQLCALLYQMLQMHWEQLAVIHPYWHGFLAATTVSSMICTVLEQSTLTVSWLGEPLDLFIYAVYKCIYTHEIIGVPWLVPLSFKILALPREAWIRRHELKTADLLSQICRTTSSRFLWSWLYLGERMHQPGTTCSWIESNGDLLIRQQQPFVLWIWWWIEYIGRDQKTHSCCCTLCSTTSKTHLSCWCTCRCWCTTWYCH